MRDFFEEILKDKDGVMKTGVQGNKKGQHIYQAGQSLK